MISHKPSEGYRDADVIVSAMGSPSRASATLLLSALEALGLPRCEGASGHRRRGDFSRAEHRLAARLTAIEVMDFLDGLARADGTFGIPFLLERGWVG